MVKLYSRDSFEIKGRGTTYVLDLQKCSEKDLLTLANLGLNTVMDKQLTVSIDNYTIGKISGVERFALPIEDAARMSDPGVLIKNK